MAKDPSIALAISCFSRAVLWLRGALTSLYRLSRLGLCRKPLESTWMVVRVVLLNTNCDFFYPSLISWSIMPPQQLLLSDKLCDCPCMALTCYHSPLHFPWLRMEDRSKFVQVHNKCLRTCCVSLYKYIICTGANVDLSSSCVCPTCAEHRDRDRHG